MLALFPYAVLIGLGVFVSGLEGTYEGIKYFWWPSCFDEGTFDCFWDVDMWVAALTQALFTMSIGFGTLFMVGACTEFGSDTLIWTSVIAGVDTFTSLCGGKKT